MLALKIQSLQMTNDAKISEMDSKQDQPRATSINNIIKSKPTFFLRPQKDLRKCFRELFTQAIGLLRGPFFFFFDGFKKLYLLILGRERRGGREGKRERHQSVVPHVYAFIG